MAALCLVAALGLAGCCARPISGVDEVDGVFIHIKSGPDEAHSLLMGLRMAQVMAEGREVLVYFDVDGILTVTADAPNPSMAPFGSAHAMLDDLRAKGVTMYACPGCIEAHGMTADDLRPGVTLADKEGFFVFTEGRILTLDY